MAYEPDQHEPRHATLADEASARGEESPVPEQVEEILSGDPYVGACHNCRTLNHVIGHHAQN